MVKNTNINIVREVKTGFKIIKIGNSQGILIDKKNLDYLDVKIGDWVEAIIKKPDNTKEKEKKS